MKALVWHDRREVRVEEFSKPPAPGAGEVILDVDWCGICGTDVEEYNAGPMYIPVDEPNPLTGAKAPLVLGHEVVGTVTAVGKGIADLKEGDRVAPDPIIFCGSCPNCLTHDTHHCDNMAHLGLTTHGGCAEQVRTRAEVCFKLPPGIPAELGALAEPAAVCVRAARRAEIDIGHSVVVVGGGTIGLLTLQMAKLSGADTLILVEPVDAKRKLAMQLGADAVIDPTDTDVVDEVKALTWGRGADRVIECAGTETTLALAPQLARKRGRVVLTGLHNAPISLHTFPIVWNETEIIGSFSHVYDVDFKAAVQLIGDGRIQVAPLISAQVPLARALEDGLEELLHRGRKHIKILIGPQAE